MILGLEYVLSVGVPKNNGSITFGVRFLTYWWRFKNTTPGYVLNERTTSKVTSKVHKAWSHVLAFPDNLKKHAYVYIDTWYEYLQYLYRNYTYV